MIDPLLLDSATAWLLANFLEIVGFLGAVTLALGIASWVERGSSTKSKAAAARREQSRREREREAADRREALSRRIAEDEFREAVGVGRDLYRRTTVAAALGAGVVVTALTGGSWAMAIATAVTIPILRSNRSTSAIEKSRSRAASEDLVPAARAISGMVVDGMSMAEAIGEYARGSEAASIQTALRNALNSPDSLEQGIRVEVDKARFRIVRDFLEILAEGSDPAQSAKVTSASLERFAEVSARRQAALRTTLNKTSQARLNRRLILVMIPGSLLITAFQVGIGTFFGTLGGNVLIIVVTGMLGAAVVVSERLIAAATAKF
jgi:hypothetical protein